MAYLLDANVFIAAKNLYYGIDFCPGFWDWLDEAHRGGQVFSIEKVKDELNDDELAPWAAERGRAFFLPADKTTVPALERVAEWVNNEPRYTPAAKNTFLQIADYYLVAQALSGGHTVVTHEKLADSRNNVKVPNACLGVDVSYVNTFDMLRQERVRFVLAGTTV